jgi:hypothetical protein
VRRYGERIAFHPLAERELVEAARFYEARAVGLGGDLIREVEPPLAVWHRKLPDRGRCKVPARQTRPPLPADKLHRPVRPASDSGCRSTRSAALPVRGSMSARAVLIAVPMESGSAGAW